jgi:AcrR family transcriptional regulator
MGKVKSHRRYDSSLRRRQAAETRARILDAAQRLFAGRGYARTTMEAIASEAAVATDTVYASFGSKAGVLHALIDLRVAGDESPVGLLDREGPRAVQADPDQRRQVAGFASGVAEIIERAGPVDDIMRGASAVDSEIRALRVRLEEGRYENMRRFVSWLAANGPLRDGLTEEEAAAVVWTIASPEVHTLLRTERGWTAESYRAWLGETVARTLLG